MQPIKISRNYTLSKDVYDQIVALEKQGKTKAYIRRTLGIDLSTMNRISTSLFEKGIWKKSPQWIKRTETLKAQASKTLAQMYKEKAFKKNISTIVKTERVRKERKVSSDKMLTVTINFKGVNVEIQKTSNIIVTQDTIFVK